MQLRNVRIGTQLNASLLLILLLVAALGGVAWHQSNQLWENTHDLYNHPLQVRPALADLRTDILVMHRDMKDLMLVSDPVEQERIIQSMSAAESDAERCFDILYDRFLGDRKDVDTLHVAFEQWKPIRLETLRLLRAGQRDEAIRRTFRDGPGGAHAELIYSRLEKISAYSVRRADKFYQEANSLRNTLTVQLAVVVLLLLLVSGIAGVVLRRGINQPLKELTEATDKFTDGNFDVRCAYESSNDFGMLSAGFNGLAEKIQEEIHIRDVSRHVKHTIIAEDAIHPFSRTLLTTLLKRTQAIFGAVYRHDREHNVLRLVDSIGLHEAAPAIFSTKDLEGQFGLPFETQEITRVVDIPHDNSFHHPTIAGTLHPKEMVVLPIVSGESVLGMVALGAPTAFSSLDMRLLDDLKLFIGTRVASILVSEQIQEYAEKMDIQNRELETQANELLRQTDELNVQNSELAMQKQELSRANSMKSAFLSSMSHELRTPLNSVIALSGVLNRRLRDQIPEQEYGYISIIERNGRHLLTLINEILDLARIEAGFEEVNPSATNVHAVAGDVFDMLLPQAREKGIELLLQLPDDLPTIVTDEAKTRQILINLVGNAVKFTDAGSVSIGANIEGSTIHISVTDTGIGSAAEHLGSIFDEFRQADETASRKHEGTGLGLAIARRYAELLRGSITVQSSPGQGSVFTLTLPLRILATPATVPDSRHRAIDHETSESYTSSTKPSILVVEDSEAARIQLRDILEPEGYRVMFAEDGTEAIEKIRTTPPTAVILDLMMPEVDGFGVLRAIRDEEQSRLLPVLILTAMHVSRQELAFLKGNNIHELIQKGDVNKRDLLASVASMIQKGEKNHLVAEPRTDYTAIERPLVLVLEDNPDNLTTITAMLQDHCEVMQAADGPSGLDQARSRTPHLVFCDIALPGMNGFQVLKEMKSDPSLRHIPVVALTARAMSGDREEILSYGFDDYLAKPIEEHLLHNIIIGLRDGKR